MGNSLAEGKSSASDVAHLHTSPRSISDKLGQAPYSAGNGDYSRIGFRYYSANYAAIIPIIPPLKKQKKGKKGEAFF
jgi:hypothetical protein